MEDKINIGDIVCIKSAVGVNHPKLTVSGWRAPKVANLICFNEEKKHFEELVCHVKGLVKVQ